MPTQLSSFIKEISDNHYEMFVDNHMLSTFSVCPRMFYYKHIQNIRAKGGPSFYLSYGIWYHHVMEQFYDRLTEGFDVEQLFVRAAKLWQDENMNSFRETDPKRFEKMVGAYGALNVGGEYETPVSALTMVKQYYDNYYELDRRAWKIISVESGFGHEKEVKLGGFANDFCDVDFYYLGRPDLVVEDQNNHIFPVDHKTTDRIKSGMDDRFKPHSETAGYIYAIQSILGRTEGIDRCVINSCAREIPAKSEDSRFKRIHPFYSQDELLEWKQSAWEKCRGIFERCFYHEKEWPMHESQCFQFNMPCEYHQIDKVRPAARETVIQANFVISDPWSPYKKEVVENA